MSSRTQVDFRGSSIQARSVDSGRVTSETPVIADTRVCTYAYASTALVPTVNSYTFTEAGSYLISGVAASGGAFSTIAHVSGGGGVFALVGTASASSGAPNGTFTPSISSNALVLTRTGAAVDTVTVTVRRL